MDCPKIYHIAKLYVKIVQDLHAIFLTNLKDIHNSISLDGTTLMQEFYGMRLNFPAEVEHPTTSDSLLHSIHNTGKFCTKVALMPTSHFDEALTQLSAIHSILTASFTSMVGITGQNIDSISSCNSTAYATELLKLYNPQDGKDPEEPKPPIVLLTDPADLCYSATAGESSETAMETSKVTDVLCISFLLHLLRAF